MLGYFQDISVAGRRMNKSEMDLTIALGASRSYKFVEATETQVEGVLRTDYDKSKKLISEFLIPRLNRGEVSGFKKLCTVRGQTLFHCFYLASKHCKEFNEKVFAYRLCASRKVDYPFTVVFYRKINSRKK